MSLSIYLHIPFCSVRCAYCDFNTYSGLEQLIPAYLAALQAEIDGVGSAIGPRAEVHTVFFGGGTPSLLPPKEAAGLVSRLRRNFTVREDCEVTFEANPESASDEFLGAVRTAGATRLSLGVQSAQPRELQFLDRHHTFAGAGLAVARARRAGFASINLDLIYGLPGQTLAHWADTLQRTLALEPDHLSLYALTLEHGTPLRARFEAGDIAGPDPDLAAEMYEAAAESLTAAGFTQYEISNWARDDVTAGVNGAGRIPSHACRHNLQYWRNLPYLGLGAGAHGYALGWRYSNVLSPRAYIERLRSSGSFAPPCSPAAAERRKIDRETEIGETMMMGLRLTGEGIAHRRYRDRFSESMGERFSRELVELEASGLLLDDGESLRLTERGRLLGNRVFAAFL